MLITLSFLAGVVATLATIRLYPILKNSQFVELVIIAVRNRWIPARSGPQPAPDQMQAKKECAIAVGLPTN